MPQPTTNNLEGWEEEFDDEFVAIDGRFLTGTETVGMAKQFISDLRKKDMEELIKLFSKHIYDNPVWAKNIIKDYYERETI
jgi:hypothetical protein